jgi:hypothetical protein
MLEAGNSVLAFLMPVEWEPEGTPRQGDIYLLGRVLAYAVCDMKETKDKATILSVNADFSPNTFRVSLQWPGNHSISDFDLERFGSVLRIQDETENTGWAVIEHAFRPQILHAVPGWAINEYTFPLNPGDTIPLREEE